MCLIVHKPESVLIPEELLIDAYRYNSDGFGIMFHHKNNVTVEKGFELQHLIDLCDLYNDRELYVHLRMATHGDVTYENCHPFQVTKNIWMMHNGVVDIERKHKSHSDTKAFINFLNPILTKHPNLLFDKFFQKMLANSIGDSRLVFLTNQGKSVFINQSKGIEWNDLWCSNTYAWSLWQPKQQEQESTQSIDFNKYYYGYRDWELDLFDERQDNGNAIDLKFLRSLSENELLDFCVEFPEDVCDAILYT